MTPHMQTHPGVALGDASALLLMVLIKLNHYAYHPGVILFYISVEFLTEFVPQSDNS